MIASRFFARRRLLKAMAPEIHCKVLRQLTSLYPVALVSEKTDHFADRACMTGVRVRDSETDVLYSAMVWNTDMALKERQVRLYIRLPSGQLFLIVRPMENATTLLAADPPLPRLIREEIE